MKTNFRPQTDAFAFINSWTYDDLEKNTIRDAIYGGIGAVAVLLAPLYAPVIGLAVGAVSAADILVSLFTAGLVPPGTVTAAATAAGIAAQASGKLVSLLNGWLDGFFKDGFGLCGGMAYASLDYYRLGWVVPQGATTPDRTTPQGAALRDYMWKRLIDADVSGKVALTTLEWMAILKFIPAEFGGGAPELLNRTKAEWAVLKQHLDHDGPWPIAIVGTTDNPMNNHQILAYGYEDYGNGTGLIYVYDNAANPPNVENTISVDFTKDELMTFESAWKGKGGFEPPRGPLKGIFCSQYCPATPPLALGLEHGISGSSSGLVDAGRPITVQFTAKNYGYGPTASLQLDVKGIDFSSPQQKYDLGQEPQAAPIASGADRSWSGSAAVAISSGWRRYFAAAHLGLFDGVDVWKNIPAKELGTTAFLDLASFASVLPGIWDVDANGFPGTLNIQSVDPAGRVAGILFNNPILGFWDEPARSLTILRLINGADPSMVQIYTGYLSKDQGTEYYSLAGDFEAFAGTGATPHRTHFGWVGHQPVIG